MDQIKIGKFISECRKKQNLTQLELAEKLHVTDRAVSKWERGKSMPDSLIMLELCEILKISVNELLNGEHINDEEYISKRDELIIQIAKQKENSDKRMLTFEWIFGILTFISAGALLAVASLVAMEEWLSILLSIVAVVIILIYAFVAIKIEQVAGYYQCEECGHKHVPSYWSVFFAMHVGRTRKMKCPNCKKHTWHKKVTKK